MPILEVEIVVRPGELIEPDSAQNLANVSSEIFGTQPGRTWVRLRTLPHEMYAENHTILMEESCPVFVSVLKSEDSPPDERGQTDLAKAIS